MKIQNIFKNLKFINYLQFLVISIPLLLITGPFLPDLFLSLSVLSFLIYLVQKKELNFLNHKFFYIFLIFFSILVISSLLSDYSHKSLITSIGYIRFGIFIFVVSYLINKKNNFIKNLYFILMAIFLILFFDAIFQKITGSNILGINNPYGRITSLFGNDIKLGGYIARLVPLLIAISIYLKSNKYFLISIFIVSLTLTLISGERTSFLMVLIFLGVYLMFSSISFKVKSIFILASIILFSIATLNDEIRLRVLTTTSNQINLTNEQPFYKTIKQKDGALIVLHKDSTIFPRIYHMYFETVIKIFKDNIFIGSGPRTYPFKSKEEKYFTISDHEGWTSYVQKHNQKIMKKLFQIHEAQIKNISEFEMYKDLKENKDLMNNKKYRDWLKGYDISHIDFEERIKSKEWLEGWILSKDQKGFTNISGVNNHPHNTYLQLLCETGLIGFLFVLSFWISCILKIFTKIDLYYKCLFIGVVINLFPFIFTGNFFNNWLSILYFYPVGFLLKEKIKE